MTGTGHGGTSLVALAIRAVRFPVVLALLAEGCIFHLDDPIPASAGSGGSPHGSGGNNVTGGAAGLSSGGANAGGTSGGGGASGGAATGGAPACPPDAKRCDGACVQVDDPAFGCTPTGCSACPQVSSANTSCLGGTCVVESCLDGFGDCDGLDSNGCEVNFAAAPPSSGAVDAFQTSVPIVADGLANDADWLATTARRQRISGVCGKCTTQSPIPPVVDPTLPPVKDLEALFRMAWNESSLYAVFEVKDDELVLAEKPVSGDVSDLANLGPSVVEDAVELLISLDQSQGGFGLDDMQLFYGLDGTVGRPNQSLPAPATPNKFGVTKGRGCYTVEVELRFMYMDPEMKFTPTAGKTIGFTAAINDWDYLRQADGGKNPARQWHIFSKNAIDQYWVKADSFGTLTLGPQL